VAADPTFSIIIPTRNRSATLKWTLRTCVEVDHPNFEIVVSDNDSSDETPEVVAAFNDTRIRYVRTPEFISMSRNFENGLKHSRGEFLIFIGDDDGVLPFGLRVLETRFRRQPFLDVIDWALNGFLWPHAPETELSLNWISNLRGPVMETADQAWNRINHPRSLEYNELNGFNLYHGCVRRRVFEDAESAGAPIFGLPIPDIGAGIRMLRFARRKVQLDLAITLNGTSRMSTGLAHSTTQPADHQKQIREDFQSQTAAEYPNSMISIFPRSRTNLFLGSLADEHLERRGDLTQLNLAPWRSMYIEHLVRLPEANAVALLPEVNSILDWCAQKGAANKEPLSKDDLDAQRPAEKRLPHFYSQPFRFSETAMEIAAGATDIRRGRIAEPRIAAMVQRPRGIAIKARSAGEEFTIHDYVQLTTSVVRCAPFDTTKLVNDDPALFRSRVITNILGHLLTGDD